MKDFGKVTQKNDPIIHFYETFLAEYNPKLRKSRGVWYTPEPVVNFIVRAVDDILKSEFGLSQGLADTTKTTIEINTQTKNKQYQSGNKKEKLKAAREWAKEAQEGVNLYNRARDKGRPCISCDKPDVGVRNASHYRSAGACSSLRFNTFNNHASCYSCNCSLSGNLLAWEDADGGGTVVDDLLATGTGNLELHRAYDKGNHQAWEIIA